MHQIGNSERMVSEIKVDEDYLVDIRVSGV